MTIYIDEHCICGMSLTGEYDHLTQEEVNRIIIMWWSFHMGGGHGKV